MTATLGGKSYDPAEMVTFLPGAMMAAVIIGAMTATGTSKHIDDN